MLLHYTKSGRIVQGLCNYLRSKSVSWLIVSSARCRRKRVNLICSAPQLFWEILPWSPGVLEKYLPMGLVIINAWDRGGRNLNGT